MFMLSGMWTLTEVPMSEDEKQRQETAKSTCHIAKLFRAKTDTVELAALTELPPDALVRRARNHNMHSKKKQKKVTLASVCFSSLSI